MALSQVAAWLVAVGAWLSAWVRLYGSGTWEAVEAHKEWCEATAS